MHNRLGRTEVYRFPAWALVLMPLLALLLQTYLPRWLPRAAALDLPLVITIYFAFNRRSQIAGLLLGAVIGLAQDSLGPGKIGVFGMVKTVIGYLASSLGARIDVENTGTRLLVVFAFYYVHLGLLLLLQRVFLEQAVEWPGLNSLLVGLVTAFSAVLIFKLLDGLRQRE